MKLTALIIKRQEIIRRNKENYDIIKNKMTKNIVRLYKDKNKKTRLSEFSPQPCGTPKGDYENSLFEHVVYLIR